MADRSDEQLRNRVGNEDAVLDDFIDQQSSVPSETTDASDATGVDDRRDVEQSGRLSRLRSRVGRSGLAGPVLRRVFSLRTFLLALVASIAGAVISSFVIPFFGSLAALAGIFAVGFTFGLLGDRRRYLEVGLAGGATAALGMLTEFLVLTIAGSGETLAVIGAGSGFIAALLGHYAGRDLRAGLRRKL